MNVSRARMVLALTILTAGVLVAASQPARAQGGLDPDAMKHYGGTYLSDCKNPASPRVTVFKDALVFIQGDKRVAASNVQNSASYYGMSPPENYETTLLGDFPGGDQLVLGLYDDASGPYLKIEAAPPQIGKPALALKYRRCGAPAKRVSETPAPAPAVTASTPKDQLPGAAEMTHDPAFKTAYTKALGRFAREDWLTSLDGPSPETKKVTVAGVEYLLIQACKNHDCADNNTTLLYSPGRKLVYGKVLVAGKSALIGSPPPAVAKELGEFWRKEWRQNP